MSSPDDDVMEWLATPIHDQPGSLRDIPFFRMMYSKVQKDCCQLALNTLSDTLVAWKAGEHRAQVMERIREVAQRVTTPLTNPSQKRATYSFKVKLIVIYVGSSLLRFMWPVKSLQVRLIANKKYMLGCGGGLKYPEVEA